jgi:hypothetical protein
MSNMIAEQQGQHCDAERMLGHALHDRDSALKPAGTRQQFEGSNLAVERQQRLCGLLVHLCVLFAGAGLLSH